MRRRAYENVSGFDKITKYKRLSSPKVFCYAYFWAQCTEILKKYV